MTLEFALTDENCNTQYGPLAALLVHYQKQKTLGPLAEVPIPIKKYDYSPASKLEQVLLSILAGCETLTEFNTKVRPEQALAKVRGLEQFSDQSNLSRTLDALTLMNLEQLGQAIDQIWQPHSQIQHHDWRGFLWLDFDLSGLPCGKQAQASQKGYFSGKKMSPVVNWLGLVQSSTEKPSGLTYMPAINIPFVA
jgi:hypothetical protein